MALEDDVRGTHAAVTRLEAKIDKLIAAQDKTRATLTLEYLRRADVAAMTGRTTKCIDVHIAKARKHGRGAGGSKLGQTLIDLARVGIDGHMVWQRGDVTAHCRPWLAGGGTDDE